MRVLFYSKEQLISLDVIYTGDLNSEILRRRHEVYGKDEHINELLTWIDLSQATGVLQGTLLG